MVEHLSAECHPGSERKYATRLPWPDAAPGWSAPDTLGSERDAWARESALRDQRGDPTAGKPRDLIPASEFVGIRVLNDGERRPFVP
jgi:hypothetical protein